MLVMESFGSDHLPKLHLFSDFNALWYVSLTIGEIHEGCKGGGGGNEQQQNCASGEL